MKRLTFFLPLLLLLWSSCKQTSFIAEDDVYSYPDPMALRPKSTNVQPEASLDGYVYNQNNGSQSTFYDPQNDLGGVQDTRDTRIVNNYFYNDVYDPWNNFYRPRYRARTSIYMGFGLNSWGYNPWGPSWGYNPWGPSWGYNPWGPSWGCNSWGMNGWGYNSWGPTWGMHPWGMNPYGYFHQPWGGMYGPYGYHGGMGMNSWGSMNWANHGGNGWNNNGFVGGGSGFGGNNNPSIAGPRPNISSSYNPNNLNVGRGNISPIGPDGQPLTQTQLSDAASRSSGRNVVPVGNTSALPTDRAERQALSPNSSPWSPRVVDGLSDRNTNASSRPSSTTPGAVTIERGNVPSSASTRPSSSSNERGTRPSNANTPSSRPIGNAPSSRPSGSTPSSRPNSTVPSTRPTSPAPSSRPSSPAPNSRPSSPSPRSSSPPSSPRPSSAPSSSPSRSSGSSGGSFGGGSSGRSSGGTSSGSSSRGGSGGSTSGSRGGRP